MFNVSKPCNRQQNLLSASRGVRSWPLEEDLAPAKVETIPLLSPTMETELLKEPWVFPQSKVHATKEEEKPTSSAWEENFQDLSGWCMDTFQGQCDFHIGESTAFKLSGTKYEGNSALSSEEGVLKDWARVTDEEKWNMKMNSVGTNENRDNYHSLRTISEPSSKHDKEDSTAESNTSNVWLKLPKGSAATTSTALWKKQSDTDVSTPSYSRYQIGDVDMDDACPTSFHAVDSQRETWDVLRTVETTGSDTFDLLSYLCEDEMRSPAGSVSTDSSTVSKVWTAVKTETIPQTVVKVKTESNDSAREGMQSRTTSTVTSASMKTPTTPSRRSSRMRTSTNKEEMSFTKVKRERQTKRRYTESDSDDHSFVATYRESREKNNEASRKSRMNKKAKESEMAMKANELEKDNRILKMKVEELEKLVTSMRSALLRSALKREF